MKNINLVFFISFLVIMLISCKGEENLPNNQNSLEQLEGNWKRLTEKGVQIGMDKQLFDVFSSENILYNYYLSSSSPKCSVSANKFRIDANKLIGYNGFGQEFTDINATFSINNNILTLNSTHKNETMNSTSQKVEVIAKECTLGNDSSLVGTYTLNKIEKKYPGIDELTGDDYNCNKGKTKLTFKSNGTLTSAAYAFDSKTKSCVPKNETGWWKTLNNEVILKIGEIVIRKEFYTDKDILSLGYEEGEYYSETYSKDIP